MMASNWARRDRLRESWIFLILGIGSDKEFNTDSNVVFWEVATANADELVNTSTEQIGYGNVGSEDELLSRLLAELDDYRYQNSVIITPVKPTLQLLRCRLTGADISTSSLRGFAHICIESQLKQYFRQQPRDRNIGLNSLAEPRPTTGANSGSRVVSGGGTQSLWEGWKQIYHLIPAAELAGRQL